MKDLKGKRVLVRCDFDVPLNQQDNKTIKQQSKKNTIGDDARLRATISTIKYLVGKKAKVILMGHLGRPRGKFDSNLSLEVVAKRLEELLNIEYRIKNIQKIPNTQYPIPNNKKKTMGVSELRITFINDCIGPKVERRVDEMRDGEILCLENLRFYMGERKNDGRFAKELAKLADIYVNESIAVSHRKHASFDAIRDYLPGFAGLHLEKETGVLYGILKKPARPLVMVIGGAKVATKLPVIDNFLFRADYVLTGGVVANNFLKAAGFEIGRSKFDKKYLKEAKRILEKGKRGLLGKNKEYQIKNIEKISNIQYPISNIDNISLQEIERFKKRVVLPVDVIIETRNLPAGKAGKKLEIRELNEVDKGDSVFDIGPKTVKLYQRIIRGARTVVWNGPLGLFEDRRFADGTRDVAEVVINSRARTIIGGGESIDAIKDLLGVKIDELPNRVFVSMAGGAMLELLAGEKLPGLKGLVKF